MVKGILHRYASVRAEVNTQLTALAFFTIYLNRACQLAHPQSSVDESKHGILFY